MDLSARSLFRTVRESAQPSNVQIVISGASAGTLSAKRDIIVLDAASARPTVNMVWKISANHVLNATILVRMANL